MVAPTGIELLAYIADSYKIFSTWNYIVPLLLPLHLAGALRPPLDAGRDAVYPFVHVAF